MRRFPEEFEARTEILFYPRKPEVLSGEILEIGPGRGDFLMAAAEANPGKTIVGIELDKRRYFKLIPRLEKRGMTNVVLVRGNARMILPGLVAPETFEKIYVLFPDPWPKKRHRPHRLMAVEFIQLLAGRLRPGGHLYCATDFWAYAEMVVDNVALVPSLVNVGRPFFVPMGEIPFYQPSSYEQKWREQGRQLYAIACRKTYPA